MQARMELTRAEPLMRLNSNDTLLALPTNIRLGKKSLTLANTLAYFYTTTFTVVKGFIV